jgi:hydroxypyruvate isomerase
MGQISIQYFTPRRAACTIAAHWRRGMPKFSAHLTRLFTDVPFRERFARPARAGFRACEFRSPFDEPAQDVAERLADAGIANVLFDLPAGDWDRGERGLASLPRREAEFRAGVDREYAKVPGTPMLHAMGGLASGARSAGPT